MTAPSRSLRFLQWNVNGLKARKSDLELLLRDSPSDVVCIQETHLKTSDMFKLNGYTVVRKDYTAGRIACGGVCIIIKNDVPFIEINITSHLQATAVKILTSPSPLTVCSLYLPPGTHVPSQHLEQLCQQLPSPLLLLGDFNAHNQAWGSKQSDTRSETIIQIMDTYRLNLLNNSTPTYLCLRSGAQSCIDLSLCTPSLQTALLWSVHNDPHGSDHFPISIHTTSRISNIVRPGGWQIKKANWSKFQETSKISLLNMDLDACGVYSQFETALLQAAEVAIPYRESGKPSVQPVPWWTEECRLAIRKRKQALRKLSHKPSPLNLELYKKARTHARYVIKMQKKRAWIKFLETVSVNTPLDVYWNTIKKLNGRATPGPPTSLRINQSVVTNPQQIANGLGRHFYEVSATHNYSQNFQSLKFARETSQGNSSIPSPRNTTLALNQPFTKAEFQVALASCKEVSPGPDGIHTSMVTHLSGRDKTSLLQIFNKLFLEEKFPQSWRDAIMIPVLKKNKPPDIASSYRPISLTSIPCKIFERLIANRLQWYMETENVLPAWQSGFRKGRGTQDNLIFFSSEILSAFGVRERVLAVLLDIENAFDRVWRWFIVSTLIDCGIQGPILSFVREYLQDRYFRVRCGNVLSARFAQQNGVPQGGVLSPLLFCLAFNRVLQEIHQPIQALLFADDLLLFVRGKHVTDLTKLMQAALSSVGTWCSNHGFRISPSKSTAILFAKRSLSLYQQIALTVNGQRIEVVENVRYLGITFDSRLSWLPHIRYVRSVCVRALNLLRMVTNTAWGGDRTSMLRLFRAVVRSRIEYGSCAYGSADPARLKALEVTINSGLRTAIGAFRSSPIPSLCCEAGELPSNYRRLQMEVKYFLKVLATTSHPLRPTFLLSLQERPPVATLPSRVYDAIQHIRQSLDHLYPIAPTPIPPWSFPHINLQLSLTLFPKHTTSPKVYQQNFLELIQRYRNSEIYYTDGSKGDNSAGAAVVHDAHQTIFALPPTSSSYTAEVTAILQSLLLLRQPTPQVIICTDSLSTLSSLQNIYTSDHLVQRIFLTLSALSPHTNIVFVWVPGHCGIVGNDQADLAARQANTMGLLLRGESLPDLVSVMRSSIWNSWQRDWIGLENNKLRNIKPQVGSWISSCRGSRREEVVLARLRIGHSRLTHGHLMARAPPPLCPSCQVPISVLHILTECLQYTASRTLFNLPTDLSILLSDSSPYISNIIKFLKKHDLYSQI